MPVLVSYVAEDRTIRITNVGAGPATNAFFAAWEPGTGDGRIPLDHTDPGGTWFNPVHLTPIPVGHTETLPPAYLDEKAPDARSFGIQYTDPFGYAYITKISDEGTIVCPGKSLPDWPVREVPYPQRLPATRRWPG